MRDGWDLLRWVGGWMQGTAREHGPGDMGQVEDLILQLLNQKLYTTPRNILTDPQV